ncbi:MAG: enoyl-CoA hydratase [Paraglaciecola psychrophila]|jgi:enoyl-CoA hydratase
MNYDNYKTLRFEYEDRVLRVLLDNGPMNIVDHTLHSELARVFEDIQHDEDCDLVILTGANKAFCAGGDADWMQSMIDSPELFKAIATDAKRIVFSLLELEKPVICKLNGAAAGLGASIALMSDIIIMDERAVIGDPHVKMGFVAGDGGAVIWPQLVGYAKAKELLLTGDMISASEALDLGLINYAVPTAELEDKVQLLVKKITANPRWAVRWTKTVTNMALRDLAQRLMDPAVAYEMMSNLTDDHQEAVSAFREKRKPNFTGN